MVLKRAFRTTVRALQVDRGEVASTLIIFLTVITMFFLSVHAAFVYHGNHVLSAAAQEALAEAQLEGSTKADAETRGGEIIALFNALDGSVDVQLNEQTQRFEVVATGKVTTPFFNIGSDLRSVAEGPAERFYEQYLREQLAN